MRKGLLTTNIWLKVTSLILAIVLWAFVISRDRSEIVMDVPVEFINVPAALKIVDAQSTVSIGVEGRRRILDELKQEDVSIVIDLSNSRAGKALFPISRHDIKLPKSFVITNISPQTVSLILEKR